MGNVMRGLSVRGNSRPHNHDSTLKKDSQDMVAVIQDYPCRDVSEPIFRMGEKLLLISEEGYWWRVHSIQTGKENYIPNSHVVKVYHGWLFDGVGRQKAEELLKLPGNRVGSFLVRENTNERGAYSLSVSHQSIKHYRIFRMDNSWYYISPRLTFQCLEDLINHYSDCADGLCCMLTSPCLSGTLPSSDVPPPVVMRHNFDWRNVNQRELVATGDSSLPNNCDSLVSYGVRNSIAAYLAFSEGQQHSQKKTSRKQKSKSVYAFFESNLDYQNHEDEF
ncbi:src like adaptor 1a [Lampris incognitus]|uniref:src like adaptor 1a n=1 Tax=Lampris incognitus TaxID=2546036 RepID=UPI0024B547AA|nr:src like adaptor 1a [Lampris incognitus]